MSSLLARLRDRLGQGLPWRRIEPEEALALLSEPDLLELGRLAAVRRRQMVPGRFVTFVVDRNINFTNICTSGCAFCAFYRPPGHPEGYVLSTEEVLRKGRETLEIGGTGLMLQGGLHPELDLSFYEHLFSTLKSALPLDLHSLSPPEIAYLAGLSGLSTKEVLRRLQAAGLDSLPGGGAEILVDTVRQAIAPRKVGVKGWLEVMREAHELGMGTTATMMFGSIESLENRVEHMLRLRTLQDETHGFRAFIPWSFQPTHTALEMRVQPTTVVEYLRTLAVARLFFDNIANIQASWVTQGLKIGQVSLYFGANDLGSTMIEENVVAAAGVYARTNAGELARVIRAAGFMPVQRRNDYAIVRIFSDVISRAQAAGATG
jgi:cyclic dehypoxanthinyl futalosine synthase